MAIQIIFFKNSFQLMVVSCSNGTVVNKIVNKYKRDSF